MILAVLDEFYISVQVWEENPDEKKSDKIVDPVTLKHIKKIFKQSLFHYIVQLKLNLSFLHLYYCP